jgi:hypothetical protein
VLHDGAQPGLVSLDPDETLEAQAVGRDAVLLLTDRRLIVSRGGRTTLDLPFDGLRRVEFNIEHERPATLVVVPNTSDHLPEAITVEPDHYADVASLLAIVGARLHDLIPGSG